MGTRSSLTIQAAFELDRQLSRSVSSAISRDAFPVVLSGNCISSLGTVSGIGERELGVIWFDAHGDLHTPETTQSGFLDGMALAILTGRCWNALAAGIPGFSPVADERVMLVGARDLDTGEETLLSSSSISRATLKTRAGFRADLVHFSETTREIYLHVDLDVLDPVEGRAN